MSVHVGRAHGNVIMGGAGAPVDLANEAAMTGGGVVGYVHGTDTARVQSGFGKKRTRTVRHKKRRTKNKTSSRSRTGRRHKKHTTKKHSGKKTHKKTRSRRRRKHSVKVHKQTGGTYGNHGDTSFGAGPMGGSARGITTPVTNCNQ